MVRLGVIRSVSLLMTATAIGSAAVAAIALADLPPLRYYRALAMTALIAGAVSGPICFLLFRLISQLSRSRAALARIAHVDSLTGAPTRRYFLEAAARMSAGRSSAVVLIDVDDFKRINDRHGHPVGDRILQGVSDACRGVLRSGDLFGRYGGEEFVVLLPGASREAAAGIVERMRRAVCVLNPQADDGRPITVTASFGIARSHGGSAGHEGLHKALAVADAAMYQAKRNGKNRWEEGAESEPPLEPADRHGVPVGAMPMRPTGAVDGSIKGPINGSANGSVVGLSDESPERVDRGPADDGAAGREEAGADQLPRWTAGVGRMVERIGLQRATLVGVLIATAVSVAMTVIMMSAVGMARIPVGVALAVATALPCSALICWMLFSQIEDIARARAALDRIAHIDALTQASTRRHFMERAPAILAASRSVAIVLLDVDHFKQINDRFGHAFGDTVLRAVSEAARRALRDDDLFARHGGEEFAVLLGGASAQAALGVAERMRRSIESLSLTTGDGVTAPVTASFGVALEGANAPPRSPQERLREGLSAADKALYRAKQDGRNRVALQRVPQPQPQL